MITNYFNEINFKKECNIKTVLALGFFDGVHVGHIKLIMKAKRIAEQKKMKLAVMTFYPHPKEILQGRKFDYLMSLENKEKKMKQLGVDYLYVVKFTKELSLLSPQNFVKKYIIDLNVRHAVAGYDFTFGHKGDGNMGTLLGYGEGKIDITVLPKVEYNEKKISSTYIRELLLEGDMKKVTSLMGENYETTGTLYICHLKNNLKSQHFTITSGNMIPKTGIYKVKIQSSQYAELALVEVSLRGNREKEIKIELKIDSYFRVYDGPLSIKWHNRMEKREEVIENECSRVFPLI